MRLGILGEDDFDDVEPEKNVGIVEHPQPGERTARDAFLLVGPNRFEWPAELFAPARFYFDKDERVVVATDDVDLAAAASLEISIENLVTIPPEKTAGCLLATGSAPQMLRRFVWPPKISKESRNAGRRNPDFAFSVFQLGLHYITAIIGPSLFPAFLRS